MRKLSLLTIFDDLPLGLPIAALGMAGRAIWGVVRMPARISSLEISNLECAAREAALSVSVAQLSGRVTALEESRDKMRESRDRWREEAKKSGGHPQYTNETGEFEAQ
jgi:hypothetical protein